MFTPVIPNFSGGATPQMMTALGGDFMAGRPERPKNAFEGYSVIDAARNSPLMGGNAQHPLADFRQARNQWLQGLTALGGNTPPPGTPGVPPTLPPQANVPQSNPVFGQPIPANMVGGSYAIPGMKPAQSGFDLPTY